MELNELSRQVQVKLHQYCYKFKEGYSKPDSRFIRQMHFGILKSGSVQLSSISRSLSEGISHKKTTERLGRHLGRKGLCEEISASLLKHQQHYLRHCRYLVFDLSDISKRYAEKMEGLGKVHDGSEGEIANGYWLLNAVGVDTEGDLLVPAYSELYSHNAEVTRFWSAVSFLYTRLDGLSKEILFQPLLSLVKRNKMSELFGFIYYKLAMGLRMILAGSRIYRELFRPPNSDQLTLDLNGA